MGKKEESNSRESEKSLGRKPTGRQNENKKTEFSLTFDDVSKIPFGLLPPNSTEDAL